MNPLYLDIGNSFLKLAYGAHSDWQILFESEHQQIDELIEYINSDERSSDLLLTSVRKDITDKIRKKTTNLNIREYRNLDIPSEMIDYKTPDTLGLDRFLVCLAAWKLSGRADVIVIDAGSACTIDLMTTDGVFKGGVIMPGLQILKKTMTEMLPELPAAQSSIPDKWPGKSTIECIGWGVNGGFLYAIQGFLQRYKDQLTHPKIYITGGNAGQIRIWLENEDLRYHKHLIWIGMEEFGKLKR